MSSIIQQHNTNTISLKLTACGSNSNLYGSNCKHITLCFKCGKSMAENKEKCSFCGTIITRLIREYNVRAGSANDKSYFVGKFSDGHHPHFNNGVNWSLRKDPKHHQGMLKKAPWILEDETGEIKYQGRREEPELSKYFFLICQNHEFVAVPADYWVHFNRVPGRSNSNQLNLEEAETMMNDRKKFTDECRRRMMRGENSCVTDFSKGLNNKSSSGIVEEDLDKKIQLVDDDDEEEPIKKGVDWEYEDVFSDDDEQVGTGDSPSASPEETQGLDVVEDNDDEEEGLLSQSGKDMKALLVASDKRSDEMKLDYLVHERKTSMMKGTRISVPKSNRANKNVVRTETTSTPSSSARATLPVTEEEVRAALLEMGPTTAKELSSRFKTRIVTKQDCEAFVSILKKLADVHKNVGSKKKNIVLKRKRDSL